MLSPWALTDAGREGEVAAAGGRGAEERPVQPRGERLGAAARQRRIGGSRSPCRSSGSGRDTRCCRCGSRSRRRTGPAASRAPSCCSTIILSAMTQLESSKPGCASGDSSWCFQLVSVGQRRPAGPSGSCRSGPPCASPAAVVTAWPFQVTLVALGEDLDARVGGVVAGQLRACRRSRASRRAAGACRGRSPGPPPVLCCQNVSAVALSPISSSSGLSPGPWTAMRRRPLCV